MPKMTVWRAGHDGHEGHDGRMIRGLAIGVEMRDRIGDRIGDDPVFIYFYPTLFFRLSDDWR